MQPYWRDTLIQVVGQGFRNAEPCFFVKGQSRGIVPGNLKDEAADVFLCKLFKQEKDQGGAEALFSVRLQDFHMMEAEAAASCRGKAAGTQKEPVMSYQLQQCSVWDGPFIQSR